MIDKLKYKKIDWSNYRPPLASDRHSIFHMDIELDFGGEEIGVDRIIQSGNFNDSVFHAEIDRN